MFPSEGLKVG